MKKFLSCTLLLIILTVSAGVYFHKTRTLCEYRDSSGNIILQACECYGVIVEFVPSAEERSIHKLIGGKYGFCYGFTKLQACKLAPDFTLTDLQKFICKR